MPRDWDATAYDELPIPMTGWGRAVVDRLPLRGDEQVLDAGCGTGLVTAYLLERLPAGSVVALDGSPSMIEAARERLPADRTAFVVHDLLEPIPIDPVDAVLSTATFHWVPDHDRLFTNLAAIMRPGAALEAQCGGAGNIANVAQALAEVDADVAWDKVFATPEETEARLDRAGFIDVECSLVAAPIDVPSGQLERYLATVCLGDVLEDVPGEERSAFVTRVADRLDPPTIDYVRLNISARRG